MSLGLKLKSSGHSSIFSNLSSIDSIKSRTIELRQPSSFKPKHHTTLKTRMKHLEEFNSSCFNIELIESNKLEVFKESYIRKISPKTHIQTQLTNIPKEREVSISIDTDSVPATAHGKF